jgi:anti-sigma regulatory factor (Ser/Thr protein kinase)
MTRKRLEFSSDTANLATMRKQVRMFLEDYRFTEKQRLLMVLGVDEACTNIIRYAYELRDDRPIVLAMEGLRRCVRMRLRDYGEPIYKALKNFGAPKPGGRGIELMRQAFDKVDYIFKRRGTELVLTKNLE